MPTDYQATQLIIDGQLIDNDYKRLDPDTDSQAPIPDSPYLVPLTFWLQQREQLLARSLPVGVYLLADQDPAKLLRDIHSIPVIGVMFEPFTDGRGFSIGRLLRERYGFQGQLRAIGAPIRDQLAYLAHCGFNAFEIAEHYDLKQALDSLQPFSERYQATATEPKPLFRRPSDTSTST